MISSDKYILMKSGCTVKLCKNISRCKKWDTCKFYNDCLTQLWKHCRYKGFTSDCIGYEYNNVEPECWHGDTDFYNEYKISVDQSVKKLLFDKLDV